MKSLNNLESPPTAEEYNTSTHLGKLVIKAIEAKLLIDTETFGKMDPFLQLDFLGKSYKTHVHQDGGKLPVWNHTFPEILIPKGTQIDKAEIKF